MDFLLARVVELELLLNIQLVYDPPCICFYKIMSKVLRSSLQVSIECNSWLKFYLTI